MIPANNHIEPSSPVQAGQSERPPRFNAAKLFNKLNWGFAWILMAVILLYAISGYGMTKGLIDPAVARKLHFSWLAGIGIIAFTFHTFWGLRLALLRFRIWNKYTKVLLVLFYLLLMGFFVYVEFFYQLQPQDPVLQGENNVLPVAATSTAKSLVLTTETLALFDGLDGRPAYAAVDGLVYDVSAAFPDGRHHGYRAGQDLSVFFHEQHQESILDKFTIVGTYQE